MAESKLTKTEWGLLPTDKGWFVANAREPFWLEREGRGALTRFEGFDPATDFDQLGINLQVLGPGEPMSCTTGRPTRKTSSCSPVRRSQSSKARSAR